ncbi:MAG: FeS assembly SUF system protein [candidate division SR1 bacterium]|nr:MAG: FeS assembly SUF system protein [candidate division SR1 bacterium]
MLTKTDVIEWLKTVYDPEFPMVDIYTLGLIYNVRVDNDKEIVHILMTFTTPACPMADMLEEMVKNAVLEKVPHYEVDLEITFDPLWKFEMIKDEDLKRMFE